MLTKSQFNTLLIPIIYHHFEVGVSRVPSLRARLFNIQTSKLAQENGTGMGGISVDTWNVYKESGESGKKGRIDFDQLYTQTYTHVEYPVELVIKKNLVLNDQYGKINRYVQRVGISAEQKMEIDAASLLNLAFDSGVLWSDGDPLCSASHPVGPHAGAGTYSNRGTSALAATALKNARVAMMRLKDDKNNEIGVMPGELWVPPELEETAYSLVRSTGDPETANQGANPKAAQNWTVVPWLRLTDTKNWFIVDPMWRQEVVNWYVREITTPLLTHETTTEVVYEFKLHYSFGCDDWRWIYGNEVS
jgi:hypothetical protein